MAQAGLLSLRRFLDAWRPALTAPGFENFLVLFVGWSLTTGTHAVTEALVVAGAAGRFHHEAFHRFFSRGTWKPDEIGRLLFQRLLPLVPDGLPIPVAIDDTLAPKKGARVFGIASHLDAVQSTKRRKVFSFGHCWVVLVVLVKVPFSARNWALPVLFRLYRSKKEREKTGDADPHRKKTELAREMVDLLAGWAGARHVSLTGDSAYCCDTVTKGLPVNVVLTGAMRADAVLHGPLEDRPVNKRGRRRKKGILLPKPRQLADDESVPWQHCVADLNGKKATIKYKSMLGYWHKACGPRLLKIVVVCCDGGQIPVRVFFSMDAALSVEALLGIYSRRWSIEVLFRDLKQMIGFADSSARKKAAVERVAPFVGLSYTTLVLWCVSSPAAIKLAAPPTRPWYTHKNGLSFADIVRAARRAAGHEPLKRSPLNLSNLRKPRRSRSGPQRPLDFAP